MPQFLVSPQNIKGKNFSIHGGEARHISRVLRKNPGDRIRIFDGDGHSFQAVLENVQIDFVSGRILEILRESSASRPVRLFFAPMRSNRLDWLIEKATELGVSEFHPIISKRTIVRTSPDKNQRWHRIVCSAAKQCGRSELPKIFPPINLKGWESEFNLEGLSIFLWEVKTNLFHEILKKDTFNQRSISGINLFVGPEGGWDEEDIRILKRLGAIPAYLGLSIFRSETAALYALSCVMYEKESSVT